MAKSKNHTNHNQNKKAHKNGIKRSLTNRSHSMKGVDPKFRRNAKHALAGTIRARREQKEAAGPPQSYRQPQSNLPAGAPPGHGQPSPSPEGPLPGQGQSKDPSPPEGPLPGQGQSQDHPPPLPSHGQSQDHPLPPDPLPIQGQSQDYPPPPGALASQGQARDSPHPPSPPSSQGQSQDSFPSPGPPPGQGQHQDPLPSAAHQQSYPAAPLGAPQPSHAQSDLLWYLGTPIPDPFAPPGQHVVPGYDPTAGAEAIRKATTGFGTNDNMLISTLVPLSAVKVEALVQKFRTMYSKTLVDVLNSGTSGHFKKGIHALATGPLAWDAELVHEAVAGLGTTEEILTEVILGRPNAEIRLLIAAFRLKYGRDLVKEVKGDLSGKTERMFAMALAANRPPDSMPVNYEAVARDVGALYDAAQGIIGIGTDQLTFCDVLINRSQPHITAVIGEYGKKHKSLSKVIKSKFFGHMKAGFLHIVHGAKPKRDGTGIWRDAKLLDKAMVGLGTRDKELVWRMVRAHWDPTRMAAIKEAYLARTRKPLEKRLADETSGSYKKLMLALATDLVKK